jgi:hypothetical protein
MTTLDDAGRRLSGSPAFRGFARAGLAARGFVYLLIGWLSIQIALGHGGRQADRNGALQTVSRSPGGSALLWLLVAGFAGLALFRFVEAWYGRAGRNGRSTGARLQSLGGGICYAAVCGATAGFAVGTNRSQSDNTESKDFTWRAMHDLPAGRWLVLVVGLVFVASGVLLCRSVLRRRFMEALDTDENAVMLLGVVGGCARALVFAAIGVFLCYAAVTFDPGKAQGVDGTLREFADTPAGPWLLVLVGLGLVAFGAFSFCEARWHRLIHPY